MQASDWIMLLICTTLLSFALGFYMKDSADYKDMKQKSMDLAFEVENLKRHINRLEDAHTWLITTIAKIKQTVVIDEIKHD